MGIGILGRGTYLGERVGTNDLAPLAHTALVADRLGNPGRASVPVALDDAGRSGRISRGDVVLLSGAGGGMAVGNSLMRWSV
ncbi:3-oxoacyl-[acyl-carrier-protein] synthase III C-terminal domain-containing protein [Streptomyces sp. NPDC052052]|uniref:3-oxoacyl-[acyl-carrier-protein] synthase III C-terminal domain-containing protein n=1 Tax=Streptomyces sp. NPDC052052 TaxID=3154756 RepID=UPI00342311A3